MCTGQSRGCALRWDKHLLHKWMEPCPLSTSKQIPSAGRCCHTGCNFAKANPRFQLRSVRKPRSKTRPVPDRSTLTTFYLLICTLTCWSHWSNHHLLVFPVHGHLIHTQTDARMCEYRAALMVADDNLRLDEVESGLDRSVLITQLASFSLFVILHLIH